MNLNNLKISTNYNSRIMYLSLFFVVASVAAVYFGIIPIANSIKSLRGEIVTQKVEMEKQLNQEKNSTILSAKLKKIEPDLDTLSAAYINHNRELEFITALEGIARNNSVTQNIQLDVKNGKNSGNYEIIPLQININGKMGSILKYLIDLETMDYYISVNQLKLSSGNTSLPVQEEITPENRLPGNADMVYNMQIMSSTYWQ